METKTLWVEHKVWKELQFMRIKHGYKTMNELMLAIIKIMKKSGYELKQHSNFKNK